MEKTCINLHCDKSPNYILGRVQICLAWELYV